MKLFHKKKNPTIQDVLVEYIEVCLKGNYTMESIKKLLEESGQYKLDDINSSIKKVEYKIKQEKEEKQDLEVDKKIKKYPKFMRKELRKLYEEYKKGNMIFPEGFDKDKFLGKQ